MEGNLPDLADKVILLYVANVNGTLEDGFALENCRYTNHAGRLFVVGIVPDEEDNWQSGLECGVAWDAVVSYVLFPSQSVLHRHA
jgi:hypothetical protein